MDGTAGGALVAVAGSAEVLTLPSLGEELLTPVERERAARFHRERNRLDFVAAHLLVRLCAARLLGVPVTEPVLEQYCPDCGLSGHGVPALAGLPGVGLSLSHTEGVVAAAAGPAPVGVDVELPGGRNGTADLHERVLGGAESALVAAHPDPDGAFLRQWVRKEAMIKIGRASLDTLASVDLSALPLDPPGPGPALHRHEDLHLLDWTAPGSGALVAAVSTRPVRLLEADGLRARG
ncbi:4'-phosphopantetheinyl transferase family protein [Kitasatospora sp. DSM 101779]|uniref:4'-phosphopantetheinyl transferase family protein n=1 Tax=Kitasatospora sp. DSM 101779 TaxID=2853165 RepID=UPI0021D98405|nr:4'-phosphopantetheinyl transferase superfamily protein [Kitasatospora sp. DSM 101779]